MFDVEPPSTVLTTIPLANIIDPSRPLFDVNDEDSVIDAFNLLSKYDIIALPVYSQDPVSEQYGVHDSVRKKNYIGMLSILDIVIFYLEQSEAPTDDGPRRNPLTCPVSEALGSSYEGRRIWVAWEEAKLGDAMVALTEGIHRLLVPIRDDDEVLYHVCSQLDVVRFLYERLDSDSVLESKADSTLVELGLIMTDDDRHMLGSKEKNMVISIDRDMRTRKALQFMAANNLMAVAVVDRDGTLFSTLSLSDIRRCSLSTLAKDPLIEEILLESHRIDHPRDLPPAIVCRPGNTLREAMRKVLKHGVHRVWVVEEDDDRILRDVVSLTNIIQALVWAKNTADDE
ncbi:hypothetical protein HDU96_007637 [Phlyctochytrium bullatum]|nr:hypothetical protein HDU96_007637 [Phlyctochytrium bullatum]